MSTNLCSSGAGDGMVRRFGVGVRHFLIRLYERLAQHADKREASDWNSLQKEWASHDGGTRDALFSKCI